MSIPRAKYEALVAAVESVVAAVAAMRDDVEPLPAPKPWLGANLESVRDYDRQFAFIDCVKSARVWGSVARPYDYNANVPVDAEGWPTADFGVRVFSDIPNAHGDYTLVVNQPLTVKVNGGKHAAGKVTVPEQPGKLQSLELVFTGVQPGLRFKLLRPGYADDADGFTREFLASLAPFKAVRFMDWQKTNNSPVATWGQRSKPTDARWSTDNGVPLEVQIALCNAANVDGWFNIPHLADLDYVKQFGALVKAKLKPNLAAYVEWSNEAWNYQFKQAQHNLEQAKLEFPGVNMDVARYQRIARKAEELMRALGDRFKVVLATQTNTGKPGEVLEHQLKYLVGHGGPTVDYVGLAPYTSPGKTEDGKWYTQQPGVTAAGILDRLMERAPLHAATDGVKACAKLAAEYGLKVIGYEGGIDLQQHPNDVPAKAASQNDPRAGDVVTAYLNAWFAATGGAPMFWFTLSNRYDKNGYWGLTEDVRNLATPKFKAAVKVAGEVTR